MKKINPPKFLGRKIRRVNLFVCGPTVYDLIHIGNAKTYVNFDIIVKYLRSRGYKVFYLQNITDIDDKIIKRAEVLKLAPHIVAKRFTDAYFEDLRTLGVNSVTKYAFATKFIKHIVSQVKRLIERGYAYKIEGDGYYFDISKFKDYGKLAHRTVAGAEAGVSRIDESINKRNAGDFCLWKLRKENEPFWKSDLGEGRPGWHIEDTAITEYFFGQQYDIHGGGLDLKFPHHEAELAQQEAASGKAPFVKFWMHSGLVSINGAKMSKSLGNFVVVRDLLKTCSTEVFRWIIATHHYRGTLDYKEDLVKQSQQSLNTIKEFLYKLDFVSKHKPTPIAIRIKADKNPDDASTLGGKAIKAILEEIDLQFNHAMEDDFNTPEAIAAIFELTNMFQKKAWNLWGKDAAAIRNFISRKLELFGIRVKPLLVPLEIKRLAKERDTLRVHKQFIQGDALRIKIEELGYKVEDTPIGTLILRKF